MSIGAIIPGLIFMIVSLVPFMLAIWALLTLREIQRTQEAMAGKLDAIERLLQKP